MSGLNLKIVLSGRWIKHPKPVLIPGDPGDWDDAAAVTPSVWKESENSYCMYYSGQGRYNHNWGIGLATSSDLINWHKSNANPILKSGEKVRCECIDGPCIQKYGDVFYMFYEASESIYWFQRKAIKLFIPYKIRLIGGRLLRRYMSKINQSQVLMHAANRHIGLASSKDSLSWKMYKGNPVLTVGKPGDWDSCGIFSPAIYKIGDLFYMFFSGSNGSGVNTGLAFSTDLIKWTKNSNNPILRHGEKGAWDERSAVIVSMIHLQDYFCAFYEGEDSDNRYRVGIAYSKDLKKWIKFEGNPILDVGDKGIFDEMMVCSPHVIEKNGMLYILYGAHNSNMTGSCGMAVLSF